MRQNRHILRAVTPPWLRGPYAESFLVDGIYKIYDKDNEDFFAALLARWPTYAPIDALPYLAADKLLISGPDEDTTAKRARIRLWMIEAMLSGLPIGILLAMQAFGGPDYPLVRVVTKSSIWYTLEAGAVGRLLQLPGYDPLPKCSYENGASWPIGATAMPEERLRESGLYTRLQASPANFDWDSLSNPERSACWWDAVGVIYGRYGEQDAYADLADTWLLDDPSTSVGTAEPYGTLTTLQYIAVQRKSAKSVLRAIVCTENLALLDPALSPGDPLLPDGYWGRPGKIVAGKLVPSRHLDCRALEGFPKG